MKNYHLTSEELLNKHDTNKETGLTNQEVLARQEKEGLNRLNEQKKRSIIKRFFDQLNDFMVYILLTAAVISIILAIINSKSGIVWSEIFEGFLIMVVVIINAILGLVQEGKAEKALESIKKMSSPHATVLRDGVKVVISVEELVVGDIVLLNAGDIIPADLRIIESYNLKIDESALTGEPVPVEKISTVLTDDEIPLGDQFNLAFMSTVVTYGRGAALVIRIGMATEIGKIAGLIQTTVSDQTPLQKNINKLGKILAFIALGIVAGIFIIDIIQAAVAGQIGWSTIMDSFMTAIALAVAAIPEGLPAIITIVLAFGMRNLAAHNAIMKTLPAVETLGSTSVICSDKTGTLTQNVMTITNVYTNNQNYVIDKLSKNSDYSHLEKLVTFSVLCNDTTINYENEAYNLIGDPTEKALIDLSIATLFDPLEIVETNKRIHEYSFDSERKLMTTINEIDGKIYSITKGAPDVVFNLVTEIDGKGTIKDYAKENLYMADQALRVLAIAYREITPGTDLESLKTFDIEKDLTLAGLVGMIDPARPEVKEAIQVCYDAGIITIMITGDHKNTAIAIAKDLNIIQSDADVALTGLELDALSDDDFSRIVDHVRVYARVSPENKVRIVNAWKQKNVVVAMTGDGVNDAPALKSADIGIAMGITGTEVAKSAADMVLVDDNFGTIVQSVSEGRVIFDNIKKAIHFLLSSNVGEIVTILIATLLGSLIFTNISDGTGNFHILSPIQILWVNLVTDSLMGIALGLDPKNPDIMQRKPRKKNDGLFNRDLWIRILWQGVMIGIIAFFAYYIGYKFSGSQDKETIRLTAQTMAFMVLAISQLFHAFNVRSDKLSILSLKKNKYLIMAFFGCLALQFLTLIPGISNIFGIIFITKWYLWLIIFVLAFLPVLIIELVKFFNRIYDKNKLKRNK